jgi:hypothetical protein
MKKTIKDESLQALMKVELANLRKGIRYDYFVADTPENREAIILRISYYEVVAEKEGWRLNRDLYRAHFLHPSDPRFQPSGLQARLYIREKDKPLGFRLNMITGIANQIQDAELEKILEKMQDYLDKDYMN